MVNATDCEYHHPTYYEYRIQRTLKPDSKINRLQLILVKMFFLENNMQETNVYIKIKFLSYSIIL